MNTIDTDELQHKYKTSINYDLPLGKERPLIFTPAAARQEKASIAHKWSAFGPFLLADEFSNWYDEAIALRETAVLGDWSPLGKYLVSGPDAGNYSDFLATRDLSQMGVGQCMYTPMVNERGKLVGDNLVTRISEDSYRWTTDNMGNWLDHVRAVGKFDVEIEDIRATLCLYSLQGPQSMNIMQELTGNSWEKVAFSRRILTEINGFEVEVVRQGFTGEHGYELLAGVEHALDLWDAIVAAGSKYQMAYLGNYASRMTRVEAGLSLLHFDYNPAHSDVPGFQRHAQMDPSEHECSPYEIGLGHFVELDAGPFIGKEALQHEFNTGSSRWNFVGLVWDSEDVIRSFSGLFNDEPMPAPIRFPHVLSPEALPVLAAETQVGWATSVSYSPEHRNVISFGRVEKRFSEPGRKLAVLRGDRNGPNEKIGVEVVALPFVERKRSK